MSFIPKKTNKLYLNFYLQFPKTIYSSFGLNTSF